MEPHNAGCILRKAVVDETSEAEVQDVVTSEDEVTVSGFPTLLLEGVDGEFDVSDCTQAGVVGARSVVDYCKAPL